MLRRFTPLILAVVMLARTSRAGPQAMPTNARSPLLSKVETSINRGSRFLLARQNADGSWGDVGAQNGRKVGETALVTLALLSCGESHQSPQLAKAIEFMRKTTPVGREMTYAIALRACVWSVIPEAVRGNMLRQDLAWLLSATIKSGPTNGMYTYGKGEIGGDFSNSQYGVLGVWYAAGTGLEVPSIYWKRVEGAWRRFQKDDGGWGYYSGWRDPYSSMTAAGTATLYITNDYVHAAEAQNLATPVVNKPLERAVKWLGDHFVVDQNTGMHAQGPNGEDVAGDIIRGLTGGKDKNYDPEPGPFVFYMLFGYERVGEASGLTRFATHRWFDEGAEFLVAIQHYDGSWDGHDPLDVGTLCNTAYALLFLSRGRSPVAIQKLQFSDDEKSRWNNRPRDAANFIHFMRSATERHMNWQIVDPEARLEDLRQAPILYIASDRKLELTEQQRTNIQTYVNEGGLLLLVNEGKENFFTASAISLCKDMWPSYSFRDLPADHPIISNNFPMTGWHDPIKGLSNGVRELAVLIPSGDATWAWQRDAGATQVKQSSYAPLANLWLYVNGQSNPRYKGETTWIDRDPIADAPTKRLVALLKFNGNWQPEPLAWTRLANILHNAQDCEIHTDEIDLAREPIKLGYTLAHLTSAGKFDLNATSRAAIKTYLDQGGVLLFDAAGGSNEATLSFEALMATLYPNAAPAPLPVDHPIYTGKFPDGDARLAIESFSYRQAVPGKLAPTKLPRLRAYTVNGKLIAIESAEDLTAGMVGYPIAGITGYTPTVAQQIVRNIVLWSDAK